VSSQNVSGSPDVVTSSRSAPPVNDAFDAGGGATYAPTTIRARPSGSTDADADGAGGTLSTKSQRGGRTSTRKGLAVSITTVEPVVAGFFGALATWHASTTNTCWALGASPSGTPSYASPSCFAPRTFAGLQLGRGFERSSHGSRPAVDRWPAPARLRSLSRVIPRTEHDTPRRRPRFRLRARAFASSSARRLAGVLFAAALHALAALLSACVGAPAMPVVELRPPPPAESAHPAPRASSPPDPADIVPRTPPVFAGADALTDDQRRAFAAWLGPAHQRIHAEFADVFLRSLDGLPPSHPLSRLDLATVLEIVVDGASGRLVKVGVVRTSGVTAFDVGALDAVEKAAPFAPADAAMRSADGNVYVTWTFHRDFVLSCSLREVVPRLVGR
jgi:TonB family protein